MALGASLKVFRGEAPLPQGCSRQTVIDPARIIEDFESRTLTVGACLPAIQATLKHRGQARSYGICVLLNY